MAAVDGVSFDLAAGETLALIGPSGCGKTTTLKLLNRLVEPDSGDVRLGGQEAHAVSAHAWRRRMGYVIQSAGLFPHLRLAENVAVTPRLLGWDANRIEAQLTRLFDLIGLPFAEYGPRFPADLSGGQAQRIGLARALAGEPEIVLMDEPFSALDAMTKDTLIEDVKRLRAELGFAAVIVTHDFSEALCFADRIAVMDCGKIVQIGPARELMSSPANEIVAQLLEAPKRTAAAVSSAFERA
ncbi:MAG: ATP-binding cassette domain-containing protein [Hyphomonadaceae bacterium]|nr:ATP-binding cassette domain-containing protein [Hyphomonadaceae bacterium]